MALRNVFANIVDEPKNQLDINVLVEGNKKGVQISTFKLPVREAKSQTVAPTIPNGFKRRTLIN